MQKENQIESKIRILLMVTGILLIGLCVSFLRIAGFGVDPFSGMNLAISGFIGWSFGNWQLVINIVLLIIVFFTVRHCIGLGTIINMVFVGYIADFYLFLGKRRCTDTYNNAASYYCINTWAIHGINGSSIVYDSRHGSCPI